MTLDAFTAPGRFYRGNIHCHSTNSDGVLPPAEVCRRYRMEGYDFISLTDHFVGRFGYPVTDTVPYRTEGFTTIPGVEAHAGAMSNGEIWHILGIGLPPDFEPPNVPDFQPRPDQETGPEIARRMAEAGAFVSITHPDWSQLTLEDARLIDAAHAVEVYNHGCQVEADRGRGHHIADWLLTEGRHVGLIATDDSHFWDPDAFGGWVMVKAEALEPEALLAALKAGHYYASQGPELHGITVEEDHVVVQSSSVTRMILQGGTSRTSHLWGRDLTEGRIPRQKLAGSSYLRVTVIDAEGRAAWSNPFTVT